MEANVASVGRIMVSMDELTLRIIVNLQAMLYNNYDEANSKIYHDVEKIIDWIKKGVI